MKLNNLKVDLNTYLMMQILDNLNLSIWLKTEDGFKNRNRPISIINLLNEEDIGGNNGYSSIEEFEKEREKIIKEVNYE